MHAALLFLSKGRSEPVSGGVVVLPCFVLNRSHRFNHVHVHVCTLYAHMCAYMCLLKRFSSAK